MSRRNSKEEKARRRLENAWKKDRYVPIATPDEYINHLGFVPNEPFFYNSAVATIINGQQFAFRTRDQLVDFVETQEFYSKKVHTKTCDGFIEVSCYYLIDKNAGEDYLSEIDEETYSRKDIEKLRKEQNISIKSKMDSTFNLRKTERGNPTALYLVRHRTLDRKFIKDRKDFEAKNPCYTSFNTIWVSLDEVKNLPTGLFTDDERVYWGSRDEALQPCDEEELDRLLAHAEPEYLKKAYEHNEDGEVIIDEFKCFDGSFAYQPRKKREIWLSCFRPLPMDIKKTGLHIAGAPQLHNIFTGQEV